MALCLSYRAVSEEAFVFSLLPQNARWGLGFSSLQTFNPQFYYQSFAFQDLRKHFWLKPHWLQKTPNKTKPKHTAAISYMIRLSIHGIV